MHMYMYVQLTAYPTLLIYYEEKYAGRKGWKEEEEGRRRDHKSNILTVYSQTYMYTYYACIYFCVYFKVWVAIVGILNIRIYITSHVYLCCVD